MIQRRKKTCKTCQTEQFIFSKGNCQRCSMLEKPLTIKKVSIKQANRLKEYLSIRKDYLEENSLCEAKLTGCTIKGTEIHHTSSRIGDNLFKGFKTVCRNCHSRIHDVEPSDKLKALGLKV